jgi:hypothetical protein
MWYEYDLKIHLFGVSQLYPIHIVIYLKKQTNIENGIQ